MVLKEDDLIAFLTSAIILEGWTHREGNNCVSVPYKVLTCMTTLWELALLLL